MNQIRSGDQADAKAAFDLASGYYQKALAEAVGE